MLSPYSSITIAGRSIAPFLGGFLISVANFESVYWACAISGVLAFIVGLMLPAESTPQRTDVRFPQFFAALRDVLSSRAIMLTSIVEAAQFLVFGAVEAFLALYAASVGIPAWLIGTILGAQLLSVIIVKPLMGNLSDRFGRSAIIFPGLALGAISIALVPLSDNVYALSALSVLYGVAFATITSSTTALVADVTKTLVRRLGRCAEDDHGHRPDDRPGAHRFADRLGAMDSRFPSSRRSSREHCHVLVRAQACRPNRVTRFNAAIAEKTNSHARSGKGHSHAQSVRTYLLNAAELASAG